MSKGLSVHVGVNRADASFQMSVLKGCDNDAKAMRAIAVANGFEPLGPDGIFLEDKAKFEDIREKILSAAARLEDGDIFLFTFSGHGSTHRTFGNPEPDRQDETILLYDCILIDNYLRNVLWSKFKKGVRILGVADCCHAGSVLATIPVGDLFQPSASLVTATDKASIANMLPSTAVTVMGTLGMTAANSNRQEKGFTVEDLRRIVDAAPTIHDRITAELLSESGDLKATLLTLAACEDHEKALDAKDNEGNSAFTEAMLAILREPIPPTNYGELMTRITDKLVAASIPQNPTLFPKATPNPEFLGQVPFTI